MMSILKRVFILPFAILCPLMMAGCVSDNEKPDEIIEYVKVGSKLPSLNLTMSNGTIADDAHLDGKITVILLFSTLCSDCQKVLPEVERLYTNVIKGNSNMALVTISRAESESMVGEYWSRNGLTMPYSAQEDRGIFNLFATATIPRVYIADATRTVRAMYDDSPVPSYDDLFSAINALK